MSQLESNAVEGATEQQLHLLVYQVDDEPDKIYFIDCLRLTAAQAKELGSFLYALSKKLNSYHGGGDDLFFACPPAHSQWQLRKDELKRQCLFALEPAHAASDSSDPMDLELYPELLRQQTLTFFVQVENRDFNDMCSLFDKLFTNFELTIFNGKAKTKMTQLLTKVYHKYGAKLPVWLYQFFRERGLDSRIDWEAYVAAVEEEESRSKKGIKTV